MAIIYKKNNTDFSIAIWQITESMSKLLKDFELNKNEKSEFGKFKNKQRRLQWLVSRILINKLLNVTEKIVVVYDEYGKPHLLNSEYKISISHSRNYVAIILSKKYNIAIDIEIHESRIEKISKKFLNQSELKYLNSEYKIEQMYIIWCAKESLYKLYSIGGLDFRKNILVKPFKYKDNQIKGNITASIKKNNFNKNYSLYYERINDLMLVYALK